MPAKAKTTVEIEGHELTLSNIDKVMYPETGFTKGDVIDYYVAVAPAMLPHIENRPITMKRYPDGVEGKFFYAKDCPGYRPDFVETIDIASQTEPGHVEYCSIDDVATLAWMANLAALEIHPLLMKRKHLDRPTMLVFDLDPGPPADIFDCIRVATRLREILESVKLQSFAKTSGGKGLHLAVPLNTPVTFEQTNSFAHAVARLLSQEDPKRVTSNMRKSERKGRVFVDWSQNDDHKSTVAPYSLRARGRPTVSTPVEWDELERALKKKDTELLVFEANDVRRRLDRHGDVFAPVQKLKQKLPKLEALE